MAWARYYLSYSPDRRSLKTCDARHRHPPYRTARNRKARARQSARRLSSGRTIAYRRHRNAVGGDVYQVDGRLLIVATDRISAFDYILPTGIPDKGRVLTQLSIFWFDFLREVTPTHFLTANVDEYPAALRQFREQLEGRSMLVKRARMIEIECVARGYLSG